MTTLFASTPDPPYYAVIFTSLRDNSATGYDQTAQRMLALARNQPGFMGLESVRQGGFGITVSYWESPKSIFAWKQNIEHRHAQMKGRQQWYSQYTVRVMRVDREYSFER